MSNHYVYDAEAARRERVESTRETITLFDQPPPFDPNTWDFTTKPPPGSNAERFIEFHTANPHVAELLADYALQACERGRTKIGMWLIWQRARWDIAFQVDDIDKYKMPDKIIAYYTRFLMHTYPELQGFFTTRSIRVA